MVKIADVVIIGGGISGLSIAYNLAKKGAKNIVVIEKSYITSGATGRCGAGVRQQWGTEMNCRLAMESIKFFEKANEELEYNRDVEFKQQGYLILSSSKKENEQFRKNVELQRRLGIEVDFLSPEEAREIVPYLNTEKVMGATYCAKDGHLNPFLATDAYANAAKRLGVEIMTYTEVLSINVERGKISGVVTSKGEIKTEVVVNAAGGYSKQVGLMAGVDIPVYSRRHQIMVTEPVKEMQEPMVISFSHNFYCQQTPHGSFIAGRGDDDEPTDLRLTSSWGFLEEMSKTIKNILPPLADLRVIRQWAGLYNMSPDKQPIYGAVNGVKGFYLAIGFSGHGFMFAPMTGLLISEIILGEKTSLDISKLDLDRFNRGELVFEPSVV